MEERKNIKNPEGKGQKKGQWIQIQSSMKCLTGHVPWWLICCCRWLCSLLKTSLAWISKQQIRIRQRKKCHNQSANCYLDRTCNLYSACYHQNFIKYIIFSLYIGYQDSPLDVYFLLLQSEKNYRWWPCYSTFPISSSWSLYKFFTHSFSQSLHKLFTCSHSQSLHKHSTYIPAYKHLTHSCS